MKKIIINYVTREKRFAILNKNKVEKMVIDQPQQQTSVGNIYLGTVTKVLPGMNAAFIDIGEDKNGFIHRDKLPNFQLSSEPFAVRKNRPISKFVFQGEKLLVQVDKDATGTKGPRLTAIIELPGNNIIYQPKGRTLQVSKKITSHSDRDSWYQYGLSVKSEEEGLVFRTSIADDEQSRVQEEIDRLRNLHESLVKKADQLKKPGLVYQHDSFVAQILQEINRSSAGIEVIVDDLSLKQKLEDRLLDFQLELYQGRENIFTAYEIEHEIDDALSRTVPLENGAYLVFDETEALTIIDVNTGKFSGKSSLAETVVATNIAAAEEILRQLRLRDTGGMILIDFINMNSEKDRQQVLRKIETALKADEKRTKLIGFTPLGILQLTRKKTKVAISESLTVPCPVCTGAGRVLSPETIAFRLERELWEHRRSDYEAVWIETTEDVSHVFCGKNDLHLHRLEEALGLKIFITIVVGAKPFYLVRQFGSEAELAERAGRLN